MRGQGPGRPLQDEIERNDSDWTGELQEGWPSAGGFCVIKVGAAPMWNKEKKPGREPSRHRAASRRESSTAAARPDPRAAALDDLDLTGEGRPGWHRSPRWEPTRDRRERRRARLCLTKGGRAEPGNGYKAATGEYGEMIAAGEIVQLRSPLGAANAASIPAAAHHRTSCREAEEETRSRRARSLA